MERNLIGQFVKGTNGNTFEGFGIWIDERGYPNIWINGKSIKLHVYIWERVNGPKPKGFHIHHKDFTLTNYDLSNLELLTYSDHRKVHAGWIRENGIWLAKPCGRCKQVLPLTEFYPRKGHTPSNLCKPCNLIVSTEKYNTPEGRKKGNEIRLRWYHRNAGKIAERRRLRIAASID